ncbi:MAG: hypothetical protein J0L87_06765 [Bacteroidetes bacterium]|nr:hypothetical protein [Bacteroidota bacterium]
MGYKIIIASLFLFLSENLFAQQGTNNCNCCTIEYKQFDFWIGEWDVFNQQGNKVGTNVIVPMQDSCLIQENWSSTNETGTSYTFYNKIDSTWNQIYIDNLGTTLQLKGSFKNNKMVLKSEKIKSTKANFYYINKITWEKDSSGNVSQKWEIIDEKESVIQVVFDGIYKRKIK